MYISFCTGFGFFFGSLLFFWVCLKTNHPLGSLNQTPSWRHHRCSPLNRSGECTRAHPLSRFIPDSCAETGPDSLRTEASLGTSQQDPQPPDQSPWASNPLRTSDRNSSLHLPSFLRSQPWQIWGTVSSASGSTCCIPDERRSLLLRISWPHPSTPSSLSFPTSSM